MAQLLVIAGDGTERTVELTDRPVTFGRQDDCEVVITESKASRRHCTFLPWRGGWRVVDEGSSNGTWIGGKPVLSVRLQPGDEVEIGDTLITFAAAASEMPKAEAIRQRRVRKAHPPWAALVGGVAVAAAAFFFSGQVNAEQRKRATDSWKAVANIAVQRASRETTDAGFRAALDGPAQQLRSEPLAADALRIVEGARSLGLAAHRAPDESPEWKKSLDRLDAARARQTANERRQNLRSLLMKNLGDPAAVQAVAGALVADERSARERAEAESARHREDAETSAKEGRVGHALEAWTSWFAASPAITRDEETAAADAMNRLREAARLDAEKTLANYQAQLSEGRLTAAKSLADAAVERLRGSGYDALVTARTRRDSGDIPGVPGGPGRKPTESEADRIAKLQKQRIERAVRTAEDLARARKFADAAILLRETAAEITDPPMRADVDARIADLSAEADLSAALLGQLRETPAKFDKVALDGAVAKVVAADETTVTFEIKGAKKPVPFAGLAGATLASLLEKAQIEPVQFVPAALFLKDVGEIPAFTAWMRKALADKALQADASAVFARTRGEATPPGGYLPHPKDAAAIVTFDEHRRIENEAKIGELTAKLAKVIEKLEATKQWKAVEKVAEVHTQIEAARKHALELIFDEQKYFYPYKTRMAEYAPVQKEVNERVEAVRVLWEDKAVAKVRPDSALTKILEDAESLRVDISFYGGDVAAAADKLDAMKRWLGKDLTVQNFFRTEADLALLAYNDGILDYNAKLKGDIGDGEREQVRITNEYRRMMGNRRMLRIHEKLIAAARGHSDDMAKLGFFDHFSPVPGKRDPADRMRLAEYPNVPCSENIAIAGGDAQSAFNGWFHSSGHHRNMLMTNWSELGTGQSGRHWTQNFGFAIGDEQVGGGGPQ